MGLAAVPAIREQAERHAKLLVVALVDGRLRVALRGALTAAAHPVVAGVVDGRGVAVAAVRCATPEQADGHVAAEGHAAALGLLVDAVGVGFAQRDAPAGALAVDVKARRRVRTVGAVLEVGAGLGAAEAPALQLGRAVRRRAEALHDAARVALVGVVAAVAAIVAAVVSALAFALAAVIPTVVAAVISAVVPTIAAVAPVPGVAVAVTLTAFTLALAFTDEGSAGATAVVVAVGVRATAGGDQ